MGGEFVECVRLLEVKNDLRFVFKGNGLEKKSDKTKKVLDLLRKLLLNYKIETGWNKFFHIFA